MNASLWTIYLPTRPQPDTVVTIFLLTKYGEKRFPGIESAKVEVHAALPQGETFESLLEKHVVALDLGGGPLDHHGSDYCTAELLARYLDIYKDPSLIQLLAYANRDDKEGKGTVSRDPLDRAFGLSGLIAALNKSYPKEPEKVVRTILPLLEAHHRSQQEHHVELPEELRQKRASGQYQEFQTKQQGKPLLISCIVSDKPSMPVFLRSRNGPGADVVVQKSEQSNHYCVLTNQKKKVNLSFVAALIRLREGELRGVDLGSDEALLSKTGRLDAIENWYYDPATNSLLNGGPHNSAIAPSQIEWEEFKQIVKIGIERG